LDEVKSRESELNASPPTFTKNVMIHVCVLLGKTQQTNLSRQKTKKKHPLSFLLRVPSFSFPFPPFAQFRPQKQKENRKISSFWKRERRKNVVKTKRAQTKHTQEERKKNSRE
jgi:hypothetical protein